MSKVSHSTLTQLKPIDYAYFCAYTKRMEFTCNPTKNDTNVRERGLPLLAARGMFNATMLLREDTRKVYSERRFIGYNTIEGLQKGQRP